MKSWCTRCRRPLTRPPVIVNGRGYGSRCADLVQFSDLLTPAPRETARKPRRKGETRQMQLEAAS
jgi:hypothetical protein